MNILVTGANGQLGMELRKLAAGSGHNWVFSDVTEPRGVETVGLDITDPDAVRTLVCSEKIDVIVNCAAFTDVEKAEDDWRSADLLNSTAAGNIASAAAGCGALLIHISTDYVFGGNACVPYSENSPAGPAGVYGATKLAGENNVMKSGCRHVIIRTAWLYSSYGNNFVKKILSLSRSRGSLKVVYDQIGTPTYAADLAEAVLTVIGNPVEGLYHYSDEGVCSWYDFAKEICALGGVECDIAPCLSGEFPSKAERPHYSVLDKSKFKKTFGVRIPYWKDSLRKCMELMNA